MKQILLMIAVVAIGQSVLMGAAAAEGNNTNAMPTTNSATSGSNTEPITPESKPPARPWPQIYSYILIFGTLAIVMRIYKYFKDKDSSPNENDVSDG
jgi:hypothetical protein